MLSTVQRLFEVLSEIVPNYKEYLNPPCDDPSLFAEIENFLGEELPPTFKEFYSIADGERLNYFDTSGETHYQKTLNLALGWRFISLSEILVEYGDCVNMIYTEEDYYEYDYSISYNGNKVKSYLIFHKKWLPIAHTEGGNYLCLDYTPADEGTKGQIININVSGDNNVWYNYASSFEDFIQLVTNLMIENKVKYADNSVLFGNMDTEAIGKNTCILPIDDIQKEKFENLPFEWKEYFRNVTLQMLNESCTLYNFRLITDEFLENDFKGILPEIQGFVMEDTYKKMLQDITPFILMPRIKELSFPFEINLSQLDFVSKYLTQIYKMSVSNVFQQEDLKIIGKFKRLFALHLNCGKIDDFSDLLSCKDLARLTLNSGENLNLWALSEFKELRMLNIVSCSNIEDFQDCQRLKAG